MAFTNNADPARLGQINKAGDADALFKKTYLGEVLSTYNNNNIMERLTMQRTITKGKSANFPMFGIVGGGYHTPGESVIETDNGYLQKAAKNEKTIVIDDMLVSPVFIADIDEAKSEYDYRAPYTEESGIFLAGESDKRVLQSAIIGARAPSELVSEIESIEILDGGATYTANPTVVFTGGGGTGAAATATYADGRVASITITNAGTNYTSPPVISFTGGGSPTIQAVAKASLKIKRYGTRLNVGSSIWSSAAKIVEACFAGIAELDRKNVPKNDRAIVLRPSVYWKLFNDSSDTIKAVFNRDFGGQGSVAGGGVPNIGGVPVYMSNNFPTQVVGALAGEKNTYNGDFTQTAGVVIQKSAVGTVKLRDLSVAMADMMAERLGWLVTSYYAVGHGSVRKEAAVELSGA